MKIVRAFVILSVLLLMPAYGLCQNLGHMHISLMEGDVQTKTPEAEDWGSAAMNDPLSEGDQIWVPEGGRAELQLNAWSYIRLDQNTALEILSLDKDSSQFYISQGHAYIYFDAPSGSVIQVDTPDASTRAFDKAIFRIDMSDQYTDVAVYRGYVETENRIGKTRINSGEMLSLGRDTDGEVAPMGQADEWEDWNKARNDWAREIKGSGSRYLPTELSPYSSDLDRNGRWVHVPEYGNCWTPTVVVDTNWAPYRQGRWIWRGGDYVWVADEPWGWAPYHYGRWAFVANTGWCWIPPAAGEVYWGPGYVGWVRTEDYVGWVPLAPGETYYGRGYYGPHSVNLISVNINQVRVTNVYKNVYINNGVTIVNRNSFATASPRIANINQNVIREKIFVKNNISIGTPAIKPTRESYFTSSKRVSAAKLPPQNIRTLEVKELKKSRPLVKAPDKSVLNPGAASKSLPVTTIKTPKTPGKVRPMLKPLQPAEKGRIVPEKVPVPKVEKPLIKPEKRITVPEGGPSPKGERVVPEKKITIPESRPVPKPESPLMKPEKRQVQPEGGPAPKFERPVTKPEKMPEPIEGAPAPKRETPLMKPEKRQVPEGEQAPRFERPETKPERPLMKPEKRQVQPEGGPAPKFDRPVTKPEKKLEPVEGAPAQKQKGENKESPLKGQKGTKEEQLK